MGPSSNNTNLPDCGCLVTSVADIAALRSLAVPQTGGGDPIAAIIKDDGTWTWDAAAVLSPEGVDDNNNGTWVKPNGVSNGSAGRWKRLYAGRLKCKVV